MADEMEQGRDPAVQKKFDAAMRAMEQGDFKKAYSAFKKFVTENPGDAEGWYCKAECGNYAAGMFGAKIKEEEIAEAYQKAIEIDGSNPSYYQSYGQFCIQCGKYDEAEGAYNEAAQADESLAPAMYSEFAIEYYSNVTAAYGDVLDQDPKAGDKFKKKALEYMLKALDISAEDAKRLLRSISKPSAPDFRGGHPLIFRRLDICLIYVRFDGRTSKNCSKSSVFIAKNIVMNNNRIDNLILLVKCLVNVHKNGRMKDNHETRHSYSNDRGRGGGFGRRSGLGGRNNFVRGHRGCRHL